MKKSRSRPLTEQEHDKRRRRIALFGSLFMVLILLFSTFAYYMTGNTGQGNDQMSYPGYEFRFKDLGGGRGVLVTDINGQEVEFQALPVLVGYLEVDPVAVQLIKNAPQVVLVSDPNESLEYRTNVDYARLQLNLAIPKMVNAMSTPDDRYQMPVANCSMASPQTPVVMFVSSNGTNESRVTTNGACITVMGEDRELLYTKDRIIYEYYGILDNGQVVG
jgi:hypothetical protein